MLRRSEYTERSAGKDRTERSKTAYTDDDSVQERRDVRRTTSRYTPVLRIRPVTQSVQPILSIQLERVLFVVTEEHKSAGTEEIIPVQQK